MRVLAATLLAAIGLALAPSVAAHGGWKQPSADYKGTGWYFRHYSYVFYAPPVAAASPPPVAYAQPVAAVPPGAAPPKVLYYCPDSRTYYPRAQSCPSKWLRVLP